MRHKLQFYLFPAKMQKKQQPTYNSLPPSKEEREQLKQAITRMIKRCEKKQNENLKPSIDTLYLRYNLIDKCNDMSFYRLQHLEEIFKHYCTHIFKTGKHMTFERLEYEKTHLTMDRFFVFLKDFELILMEVKGKKEEVVDKNNIITIFKKVSSNSKDLNFEEFISCLEKLAVLYYDEKLVFFDKKQQKRQEKEKRKQEFQRRRLMKLRRRKKKAGESSEQIQNQGDEENEEGQKSEKQNEEEQKEQQNKKEQEEQNEKQDNNDLVDQLMNDQNLQDPNEQVQKIKNRYADSAEEQETKKNKFDENDDLLLLLTNEEKVEFYYQILIRVDNVADYRKRMSDLNLPIFQTYKREKIKSTNESETKIVKASAQIENGRMEQIKRKMEEKKNKQKAASIPKHAEDDVWMKAEEDKRRKRELKKEREEKAKIKNKQESDAILQKKLDSQKIKENEKKMKQKEKREKQKQKQKQKKIPIEYNEKQVDWNSLGKLSIDQLRLKQFNPNKFFSKDDDDKIFLDEYEGGRRKLNSGFQGKERDSISIVQEAKKRANEVQQRERKDKMELQNLSKKLEKNGPVKNRF